MSRIDTGNTPLYLNTLGIVNSLGASCDEVLKNLLAGSLRGIVRTDEFSPGRPVYVGRVDSPLPIISDEYAMFNSRNNRLLLGAYAQIRETVEALIVRYGRRRIAIVLGSSTSGILEGEQAVAHESAHGGFPPDYHYKQQEIGSPAEFLATYIGAQGLAYTLSTACSSSAKAFASAANLVCSGLYDVAIVGGVDSLCKLTINGFAALESLSAGICNPLSKNRDGITIGEAAALFVLSKEPAHIRLLGTGESSDAYHISAPSPDGAGAKTAILAALREGCIRPDEVDYINLHGTATDKNDSMEAMAVAELFGENVPCSSTKPMTGHTLGAAGATEVGFCWLLLSGLNKTAALPPNLWDGEADPSLAKLDIVGPDRYYSRDKSRNILISNSFAFGGSNACVAIGVDNP
jgi:3-oxoacyl-[acyl-carrier-protein] synthase-1